MSKKGHHPLSFLKTLDKQKRSSQKNSLIFQGALPNFFPGGVAAPPLPTGLTALLIQVGYNIIGTPCTFKSKTVSKSEMKLLSNISRLQLLDQHNYNQFHDGFEQEWCFDLTQALVGSKKAAVKSKSRYFSLFVAEKYLINKNSSKTSSLKLFPARLK